MPLNSPPIRCVLNKLNATIPSFTSIGYFPLLATRLANAVAHSGVNTARSEAYFFFCVSASESEVIVPSAIGDGPPPIGLLTVPSDQIDLTTLTRTRVPSLLIEIESERFVSAKIRDNPVTEVFAALEGGRTRSKVFSTAHSVSRSIVQRRDERVPSLLQRCFTIPIALVWTTSAIASAFSSQTPL